MTNVSPAKANGILGTRDYYKPFQYPWAYEAAQTQKHMHWTIEEIPLQTDVSDFYNKLTEEERGLVTNILKFFTTADVDVASAYSEHYLPIFKLPELRMALLRFGEMEVTHMEAYSALVDTLGLPEDTFKMFMEYKAMRDKHEYLSDWGTDTLEDLAKTIAVFSAFTEGVQLFASFVMLLNFQRFNLMKGLGTIVNWSIKDECVSADHSVLTPKGWVPFPSLQDGDKVAQFDPITKEISFVVPSRVVRKHFKGTLRGLDKRHISILATPNHDVLLTDGSKYKMQDFNPHNRKRIPTAGYLSHVEDRALSPLEKLMIAYAADGRKIIGKYRNGNLAGYQRVTFVLKKGRKIDRLLDLAEEEGIRWDELEHSRPELRTFTLDFPQGKALKNLHEWVDIEQVTPTWGKEFIDEVVQWDGSVLGSKTYCTTNPQDAELVQTIAHLSGITTTMIITEDTRKETYKDYYRVTFWDQIDSPSGAKANVITEEYDGTTYCVTVPTGSFLIKRNHRIHATGNCLHVETMSHIFRTLVQENPGLLNDELKFAIYSAAERVVALEDAFIDTVFENVQVKGMTPLEVKLYIRYIANNRLGELGLKGIFGPVENPFPWVDTMLGIKEHTNFFESKALEYSKAGSLTGEWSDVFK